MTEEPVPIHAFMRRDWFPCAECSSCSEGEGGLYCSYNRRPIRWDPRSFGCGAYSTAEEGQQVQMRLQWYRTPPQTP